MSWSSLRRIFSSSDLFAFNLRNRDRWIAEQAALLPEGSKVLDVGAGSAPYRSLFVHCNYKTQDFSQLRDDQLRYGGYAPIDFVSDAKNIPVPDASFDAVICTEVLGSGIHQEPYHFYGGYTPFWYERFLSEAGFKAITVTPNDGTFRHIAQETIRFVRMSMPFSFAAPWYVSLMWLPFWLLFAPVLAIGVPVAAKFLDRFDSERRFTVGYHITAIRKD